jgi:short-subunit dehydrogenase
MDLTGKNAVITGGTGSIGKAIAMKLISRGVNACLLSRNSIDTSAYHEAERSGKVKVLTYKGNLTCDDDLEGFCKYIGEQVATVDILVQSAGVYYTGTIEDTPVEELDRIYRANLRAPYLLTRLLLPRLKRSKGQIVFINSSAGLRGGAKQSQYAATKFALHALSDSLRQEVNGNGIRVLSVFPGRTASQMHKADHRFEQHVFDPEDLIQPQDIAEIAVKSLELPATAEVTDIHIRPFIKSH